MNTTMKTKKKTLSVIGASAVALATLASIAAGGTAASAHGSADNPVSRIYGCYLEGAENPVKQGCKDIKEQNTSQAMYNWQGLVIPNSRLDLGNKIEPQYRAIMKDGNLCSGGQDGFSGVNSTTTDWPTTQVKSGQEFEFLFQASQVHNPYEFTYYVTKNGWDDSQPLGWDDLDEIPFLKASAIQADSGNPKGDGYLTPEGDPIPDEQYGGTPGKFHFPATLPDKRGHHVIFSTWQGMVKKDGSIQQNEAFVSCSDVIFK